MNYLNWLLKMNMEGEIGLLRTGLWCGGDPHLVWKHRNVRLLEKCVLLHFFIIWISCPPGALCYQNIRVFIPKTGCRAARPCLIIQQFGPRIVISCLRIFWQVPFCILILWQNKEKASILPPKTIKKHSWPYLTGFGDIMQQHKKMKDRTCKIERD